MTYGDKMVIARSICSVPGCEKKIVSKGLCDMHRIRFKKHGHLETTRPQDWGKRDSHPLHNTWCWRIKRGDLCDEWKNDFWTFVKELGDRPSHHHKLIVIDPTKKAQKGNVEWRESVIVHSEDVRKYRAMYAQEYRKMNPDKIRDMELKKMYGMTSEDYNKMVSQQNGLCAICSKPEMSLRYKRLSVDHCHKTGEVRGLLCTNCNKALGSFGDSISILKKAIAYLENSTSNKDLVAILRFLAA